ncbi:MAG: DUF2889 domain-containing protein [Clostridia bacterium]|nr:DUF2889 domain-containing protein [Clostridia bacterium]
MEIFQRKIKSRAVLRDDDTILVEIKLDDNHHEIELCLEIEISTLTITAARGRFIRSPFDRCADTIGLMEGLTGVKVAAGVWRTVSGRVGGPEGCTRLYELVMEALRVAMQAYFRVRWGHLSGETRLAQMREALKDECYIYSHPELELKPLQDSKWSAK